MTLDKVSIGVNLFPKNRLKHLSHRNFILYRALPHHASITVLSALAPYTKNKKPFEKNHQIGEAHCLKPVISHKLFVIGARRTNVVCWKIRVWIA